MSNPIDDRSNRRRSQRVMLQVAVLVIGETPQGHQVRAEASTQVVNAHGGLLNAPFRMAAGQKITIVNPQSGQAATCRIVRVDVPSDGYYPTAFEFDERNPRFWPISFPPADWAVTEEVA
jgi:hypothetical protein